MQNRRPLIAQNVDLVPENLGRFIEKAYLRKDDDESVILARNQLASSADYNGVKPEKMLAMSKLLAEMKEWVAREQLDAAGVDCWTYMQDKAKVCACSSMAAMSQSLKSFACETDVYGALSMQAASAAAGRPVGLADVFNCMYSSQDAAKCKSHSEIGTALYDIASKRDMTIESLLDNLSTPFHCGVWADDLTGDARCDTQLIMEKFVSPGDSIGCRTAYLKEGPIVSTRIAPGKDGVLAAYVFVSEALPPINGVKSFGNYGMVITPDQEKVVNAIHGDVTNKQRVPFPHHGAIVRGGNDVADSLVRGYQLSGYKVMDLRKV